MPGSGSEFKFHAEWARAQEQRKRIQDYWRDRGVEVDVRVERCYNEDGRAFLRFISETINGIPRRYG